MVLNGRKSSSGVMQGGRRISEYRENELPSQLYDTSTTPRLSEASMFDNPPSNGTVRQEPFPWRTTLVGVVLLIIGVFFLLTALLHFRKYDNDTDVAFIVLGSIAFLPGCYAIFSIFQWYRGVPGFHLSDFAHWDEDR